VILRNQTTTETRVLDVHTGRPLRYLVPGGMNGDWLRTNSLPKPRGHRRPLPNPTEQSCVRAARKAHYARRSQPRRPLPYVHAPQAPARRKLRGTHHQRPTPRWHGYHQATTSAPPAPQTGSGVTTAYFDGQRATDSGTPRSVS
jgi:hypothetical protein